MIGNQKSLAELARDLEEREELMSYVFEATGDGIWDWRINSETVSHNISWCHILGLDEDHLEHPMQFYISLIHPDDFEHVNAALKACLDGTCDYTAEYRLSHTRGEYVWVMDRGKIVEREADGSPVRMVGAVRDITERRCLEMELEKQKNLLNAVLENMDAYVYMKDRDRCYRYANEKLANLYRMPVENIVGQLEEELLPKETVEKFESMDKKVLESGKKACGEEIVLGVDGENMHCWSIKVPLFKDGEVDGLIGMSTDITEVIQLKNKFHDLARTDELTGVLTRRFLIDYAEKELNKAQRRKDRLALLLIDIDHFKGINDTYGHAFGDDYIVAIVDACRNTLRESDMMGRLGGDEFVIIVDDTEDNGMKIAAERFQDAVRKLPLMAPDGTKLQPSISIGAAISDQKCTVDSLMADADGALYQAKEDGRGVWRIAATGT